MWRIERAKDTEKFFGMGVIGFGFARRRCRGHADCPVKALEIVIDKMKPAGLGQRDYACVGTVVAVFAKAADFSLNPVLQNG